MLEEDARAASKAVSFAQSRRTRWSGGTSNAPAVTVPPHTREQNARAHRPIPPTGTMATRWQ
jgi:hypothetical protein